MSKAAQGFILSGQMAALFVLASFMLNTIDQQQLPIGGGENFAGVNAAEFEQAKLTGKLVGWVSEQCEQMAQEMDAIIRLEAAESTERFSVVNYLRYLALYDQLSVVAKRSDVDKLRWVAKKVKAYKSPYAAATNLLLNYVRGLDLILTQIEMAEKKSKQEAVGKEWVHLYETVNYIATHAPKDSTLASEAFHVLQKSPNGTEDKKRSTRYALYVRVN